MHATRAYSVTEPSPHRLAFFPCDVESVSYYLALSELLLPTVEVLLVQCTDAYGETGPAFARNSGDAVDQVVNTLAEWADRPLALFGDGGGARLAYTVAERLEREAGITPSTLFVCNRAAPPQDEVPGEVSLHCPLVAIASPAAPEVSLREIRAWGGRTRADFALETLHDVACPPAKSQRQVANLIHDQLISSKCLSGTA